MKQSELYEQIEAYLNHTLSPGQRQEWEQRMTEDPALSQEVALHRSLKGDFDPGRIALRANLRDIMQEPLPSNAQSKFDKKWYWWISLGCLSAVLILYAVWMVWEKEKPASPEPEAVPIEMPKVYPDTIQTPKKAAPIAKADPARFKPNPSLEAFVNSKVRSESIAVKMSRPINGQRVRTNEKSTVQIRFTGTILNLEDQASRKFMLTFFDNKNANKPVLELLLPVKKDSKNGLMFDFKPQLKLGPGLYYFTIEAVDQGEILYAGKFLVD